MEFWNGIRVEYEEPIKYYDRKNIALRESFDELDKNIDSIIREVDRSDAETIKKNRF